MSYILNGGARYQSVEELEQALNDHFLDFNRILQMDEDALREIKGIGPTKAKQIMAVLALHQAWSTPSGKAKMPTPTSSTSNSQLTKNSTCSTSIEPMRRWPVTNYSKAA